MQTCRPESALFTVLSAFLLAFIFAFSQSLFLPLSVAVSVYVCVCLCVRLFVMVAQQMKIIISFGRK